MQLCIRFVSGFVILIHINGCGPFYYPGIYGSKVPPVLTSPDKEEYRAINIDAGKSLDYNPHETNNVLRAHYVLIHSGKYVNINSGIFGSLGNYKVVTIDQYQGNKNYYGLAPFLNLTVQLPIEESAIGFGAYIGQAFEFGSYERFLKESDDVNLATNEISPCFLLAVYPYLRIGISKTSSIGLQFAVGIPGIFSPSILYQQDKHYYWVSAFPTQTQDKKFNDLRYFTFGFGFRL